MSKKTNFKIDDKVYFHEGYSSENGFYKIEHISGEEILLKNNSGLRIASRSSIILADDILLNSTISNHKLIITKGKCHAGCHDLTVKEMIEIFKALGERLG